jgi:hypothetical protein
MTDDRGSAEVLRALADAHPGTCKCGHTSAVHGFGVGECWCCAFDDERPDCDRFSVEESA